MARNDFDAWIPEEYGSDVIRRVNANSGVELLARREPMNTDTKHVPRSSGMGVDVIPKGSAYGEDTSANGEILLTARKFGKAIRIAEEDLADTRDGGVASVIAGKQQDWAVSYAKMLDNAALGVTAAENGTTVPFTSVYARVMAADADAGYTAGANRVATAGTGANVSYANISAAFSRVESGDFFDPSNLVVIAHPLFLGQFREVKDGNGAPIFDPNGQGGFPTMFGAPVTWSTGARTSAVATPAPTGNPLMIVANRDHLVLGIRSGPESFVIDGSTGASALTDEALLKMRARRGFGVGDVRAISVLELLP